MPARGLPACDASHTFRTIQNDSGLPEGPATASRASWACG